MRCTSSPSELRVAFSVRSTAYGPTATGSSSVTSGRSRRLTGPHAGEELFDVEGLGDVVVGAGVEGDDLVAAAGSAEEHDDGHVGP
jgi:hypothetical protein